MRHHHLLFLILALFATGVVSQCMFTNPTTGAEYDLSVLTIPAGQADYIYQDTAKGLTYSINICGQSSMSCVPPNGVCQEASAPSGTKIYSGCGSGNPPDIEFFPYYPNPELDGVTLSYHEGGKLCPSAGVSRKSYINILCDENADYPVILSVKEDSTSTCTYRIDMNSSAVCTGATSSGGQFDIAWIFVIVVVVVVVLYLGIGMLIKYKKYEARGIDIIPNIEFWKDVPFLFKDGCAFFIQKISRGKFCGDYVPGH